MKDYTVKQKHNEGRKCLQMEGTIYIDLPELNMTEGNKEATMLTKKLVLQGT